MSVFTVEENVLPKANYEYITSSEDVGRIMSEISSYDAVELDTETTGLDPYTAKPTLLQIGVPNKAYVFDVRHDTEHSDIHIESFKPILRNKNIVKILQNAVFDMKMIKVHGGYYVDNIYDTMLVEQLFNLGKTGRGADLASIVKKYLGLVMNKEPRGTFESYAQTFSPYQLEYAAGDVTVLSLIRDLQAPRIISEGFQNVSRLEFEFTKPMCEMELNGITLNEDKWRVMLKEFEDGAKEAAAAVQDMLRPTHDQNIMFGMPVINIDSNQQLLKSLRRYGLNIDDTGVATLNRFKDVPVVEALLKYRKLAKLCSTYGESLLEKINPVTGRLHTRFRQMVSTGRMSSSAPNLQNIPKKQRFRSCFVSKPGYSLITSDMSGAELRILGNLSQDPMFIDCFSKGVDLHSRSASEVFNVPIEEVDKVMRNSCKAISFGLMYGLSKYGLAARLKITEKKAEEMINNYFGVFESVKNYLEKSAREAVQKGYTQTVAGRKRFYNLPVYGHPDRKRVQKMVERQAKNAGIQGANADTVKEAMIFAVDRLEESGLDAKLLLTVHDEIIVEVRDDQVEEASKIVESAMIDGFGRYFTTITMNTDVLSGPTWLKDSCSKCGCKKMKLIDDEHYISKLVCSECGADQE